MDSQLLRGARFSASRHTSRLAREPTATYPGTAQGAIHVTYEVTF